ncbi:MAG: RluA family pseudouridine synthase [Vicinamibacteraceae bacterium]|nr:RluA family pseudouridine synthase [Vicinamibacteraceae bacterium]
MRLPPSLPRWTAGPQDAGSRLDKFLAAPDRLGSRSRVSTALERGRVFVNDVEMTRADAARPLAPGDAVLVWADRPGSAARVPPAPTVPGAVRILHEDEALVVVDKPAGMLTVPLTARAGALSVQDHLAALFRARGMKSPLVVHRIDRDTTGLVVFARDPRAQAALAKQFRQREPQRIYLAVVCGRPEPAEGIWVDTLVWNGDALVQEAVGPRHPRGARAVTRYRTVERFTESALLELQLETGKRNQIRIQAALRGHPLVGERQYVYGRRAGQAVEFPRQALHAHRLAFRHPASGAPVVFEAPLPDDIATLLARLRTGR